MQNTLYVGVDGSGNYSSAGGRFGGAFDFDGVDDYVNCGNDSSLNPTAAGTIEVWVKSNGQEANWPYIVAKHVYDFSLRVNGANEKPEFMVGCSGIDSEKRLP